MGRGGEEVIEVGRETTNGHTGRRVTVRCDFPWYDVYRCRRGSARVVRKGALHSRRLGGVWFCPRPPSGLGRSRSLLAPHGRDGGDGSGWGRAHRPHPGCSSSHLAGSGLSACADGQTFFPIAACSQSSGAADSSSSASSFPGVLQRLLEPEVTVGAFARGAGLPARQPQDHRRRVSGGRGENTPAPSRR